MVQEWSTKTSIKDTHICGFVCPNANTNPKQVDPPSFILAVVIRARPFWLFHFRSCFFVAFLSCGGVKLDCRTETFSSTPRASEVSEFARRRVTMGEHGILDPANAVDNHVGSLAPLAFPAYNHDVSLRRLVHGGM